MFVKGFEVYDSWWQTGLCTERANRMKPSALGLILSVTAGCPGQFTEILQDTTSISFCGENRGCYESQFWTSVLINLSLCILSFGLDHLKPLAIVWLNCEVAHVPFPSLFCKSPLSCPSPPQFDSQSCNCALHLIPMHTQWHPFDINNVLSPSFALPYHLFCFPQLFSLQVESLAYLSYPCCQVDSFSVSLTWHAGCLQSPHNCHSCHSERYRQRDLCSCRTHPSAYPWLCSPAGLSANMAASSPFFTQMAPH